MSDQPCAMQEPMPQHKKIMKGVGTWDVACKYFMDPTGGPMESTATDTVEALGGFWTVSNFEGNMMGAPFTGKSILGYDPMRGKYVSTWIDSMMPNFWYMEGDFDESGETLNLTGKGPDHTGQGMTDWRITMTVVSDDEQVMRMFMSMPDGSEVMAMENTYTRRK